MEHPTEVLGSNSIAVIGMAGRFPGARNIRELWPNLRDGVESISLLSGTQLRAAGVSPAEITSPDYVRAAAVLEDLDRFDASFFGLSPKDASIMDPQHRHFLESCWEALENSGWCPDEFDGRIGVYAGSGMNSYLIHNLLTNPELVAEAGIFQLKQTGNDKDVLATRVSYQLGLTGPSISVQTACSTSLVAIHLACQGLLNHECDIALAGGVTIEIPHGRGYVYRQGEILSRDGHCRAFDADSSGTIFGSGAGVVVLRRLEDAWRDGDFIRAIVRGTAINNDGARKVGYLAPSVDGQAEVIAEALAIADVAPSSISYVETHGTGTALGDPIEITALTRAFRESTDRTGFCAIGSLKTNIGHLDAAAGVAGFIKTVLALEHAQIPPSLNFSKPNPLIDFGTSPFFVNTELRDWEVEGQPRRAGITSLGIGGTNAHAILEEAPALESGDSRKWQLLTLSAKSQSAIESLTRSYSEQLSDQPAAIADVAYTCHTGRKAFPVRRALVCRDAADAAHALKHPDSNRVLSGIALERSPGVVFLFSGQGSQYSGMGRGLYESEPAFRNLVDFCSEFLRQALGLDLSTALFPSGEDAEQAERLLNETRLTQPALFVIEYALAKLWQSWGIEPRAMFGHSIGEFAAACVAGVFSLESALEIVAERGRLMQGLPPGAMAAVTLPEEDILSLLGEDLCLAGVNSAAQCVISGPQASINRLETVLTARGVISQRLRVSHAFHSSMMDPILEPFTDFLGKFDYSAPRIPYVSSVSGNWITAEEATDPHYWARQLRHTVRFYDGMTKLLKEETALFLEVGPGGTLLGLAGQHKNIGPGHGLIASMRARREPVSDLQALLQALGKLWVQGQKINWRGFHGHERRLRVPLPTYPFERKRCWIEPGRQLSVNSSPPDTVADDSTAIEGLFHPVWKRAELDSDVWRENMGPWLIFQDPNGLGAQISHMLRGRGERCIEVTTGEAFSRLSADRFQVVPEGRGDYERLISELDAEGRFPRTIVHLWSIASASSAQEPLSDLAIIENLSFFSLLFLAQALGALDPEASLTIGVVSDSLQQVAGERIWRPERALLMGPCGVIPREFPNIRCRSIDVVLPSLLGPRNGAMAEAQKEIAALIVSELGIESKDRVVAYRDNRRWARSVEPLRERQQLELPERGVYLITGGLGGIGLALAVSLARSVRARLVLVSRSELPPRQEWESRMLRHDDDSRLANRISKIQSIEKAGGEVLALSADVTNAKEMGRVVTQARRRFGRIDGVIHAAGVLDDALILNKNAAAAARVLAPKVRGTLVLEAVLADDPPELFLLMSSVSALAAPPGQVDYAGANAFLDAFACERSARQKLTISIQWPRWRDLGMAADAPAGLSHHPLIQGLVENGASRRVYSSEFSLAKDWIVDEHRLGGGPALFPGTGYIEMVRAALAGEGRDRSLLIRNLRFELPLRVEDGSVQPIRLTFDKRGTGYSFSVASRLDGSAPGWVECACGEATFVNRASARPRSIAKIQRRCSMRELDFGGDQQNRKQERYISFGPRWRSLKRVFLGRREALSVVELPNRFISDLAAYGLHPAVLDMATGSAMFLIPGYEDLDFLYVPVGYGSILIQGSLPAKCYGHIRAKESTSSDGTIAAFDISILDEQGSLLVEIQDFSLQQIRDPALLESGYGKAGDQIAKRARILDIGDDRAEIGPVDSITSRQGIDAFERLLAAASAPNITVFSSDLGAFLAGSNDEPRAAKAIGSGAQGEALLDDVEVALANWWKGLLGLSKVGRQDDFFELGGQSLTAIRLLAKIKKAYGLELNSAVMLQASTIESLARLIHNETPQPSSSSVIPMQTQGSLPTLFLIHALGGRVIGYNDLVKHLKRDQPVYGVEFAFAGSNPDQMRMEKLAAHYVREIRGVQRNGPYHLLGYSFGGLMAFEIAHQLRDAGESVAFLGLLDTWQTGHLRSLEGQQSIRRKFVGRVELRILHAKSMFGTRDPSALKDKLKERISRFWNDLTGLGLRTVYSACGAVGVGIPKYLQRAQDINWYAVARYIARRYPGHITLFRAEEGIGAMDARYGDELGWGGLAEEGIEVHRIPGTHLDLMKEPNVRILAQELSACLRRCREDRARNGQGLSATPSGSISSLGGAENPPELQSA